MLRSELLGLQLGTGQRKGVLSDQLFYCHPPSDAEQSSATYATLKSNIDEIDSREKNEEVSVKEEEGEMGLERRIDQESGEADMEAEIDSVHQYQQPQPSSSTQSFIQQQPSSSTSTLSSPKLHRSPLATVHDLSVTLDEFKLTESELMLGKKKPYWIPDEECPACMLCSTRFSIVNRRHHCRACGRVLCRACCSQRRQLIYMEEREGKQRVCSPCNRTLDRIEEYEKRIATSQDDDEGGILEELNQLITERNNAQPGEQSSTPHTGHAQANSAQLTRRKSADESSSASSTNKPKKSLLKQPGGVGGKHLTSAPGDPSSHTIPQLPETIQSEENAINGPQMQVATAGKRSVTFRDGVNPGQDSRPSNKDSSSSAAASQSSTSSAYQWLVRGHSNISSSSNDLSQQEMGNGEAAVKKMPRKLSRRSKERRIEEEGQSLLSAQQPDRIWKVEQRADGICELLEHDLTEIVKELATDSPPNECNTLTIALRRNFHLRIEKKKVSGDLPVLSICTRGLTTFGVDELLFVLQFYPTDFSIKGFKVEMLALLEQFDHIFQHCLDPQEDTTFDHQMGIRKCVSRMARLYPLPKKRVSIFGHKAASILFHRPHNFQYFGGLNLPDGPFLVGVLIRQEELPWAMCAPSRILLRLGMLRGEYPFPIVNVPREQPVFTAAAVQSSVLKVLNDFRQWTYRMARLSGTVLTIRDNSTEIVLSNWMLDEIRPLVESNRNMIGWTLSELSSAEADMEIDSHLVCLQEGDGPTCFSTRIFTPFVETAPRKATGASFVIFDGALKGGEQFLISLVEDGLVIRLQADLMEELVKALLTGDSFSATNEQNHRLCVYFRPNDTSNSGSSSSYCTPTSGALKSPIDSRPLDGQFQYGLSLTRQLRSLNFFQFSSEWALRLSAVINMLPGKFPSALQPRFFEVCEQLATHIVPTLEPFLAELITANQRSISLRVHVEDEEVSYETEKWPALLDQHFVWTVTLDEQIIPFLYALCAWVPNSFFVELQMAIVSTRPLPALTVPANS